MLQPTFKAFPQDPASKDAAGVPFGCVAQPLAPFANEGEVLAEDEVELADVVARCEGCYGYISSYCTFMRSHWRCSHRSHPGTGPHRTARTQPSTPRCTAPHHTPRPTHAPSGWDGGCSCSSA